MAEEEYLLDFYGTECSHCFAMDPLVEQLEEELGVKVKKLEIWHNSDNAKLFEEYAEGKCGSVPFFYNTKTGGFICGNTDYKSLKKWATGESKEEE